MLLALVSAVAMASSGVIARLSGLAAAELTFYRLAVGAFCLLLLLLVSGRLALLALRHKPAKVVSQALTKIEQQFAPLVTNAEPTQAAKYPNSEQT